jgi:hypothetical protein
MPFRFPELEQQFDLPACGSDDQGFGST